MKKKVRRIVRFLFLILLIVSVGMLARQFVDNRKGEDAYSEAERLASMPRETTEETTQSTQSRELIWTPETVENDPNMELLADINLEALREVNADVVGWILIPGTNVNYPLMRGEDNEYYLENTWERESSSVGAIFLEQLCSPDLTDFNTIVYGHNMMDGSMFAVLKKYENPEFWSQNPYVYLATDAGVYRYEIFSTYKAKVESGTYAVNIKKDETKENYIAMALTNSVIDTGITPAVTDRILTLSTCSRAGYETRWVVHARLPMVETEG